MERETARALALFSLGRQDEFEAILGRQIVENMRPEGIARLYAWSNQPDESFLWLERMIREFGSDYALSVRRNDLYKPIKADPRWQELLERFGTTEAPVPKFSFEPEYPPILQLAVDEVRERRKGIGN